MSYRIPETEIFLIDVNDEKTIAFAPLKSSISLIDRESALLLRQQPYSLYDEELRAFVDDLSSEVPEKLKYRDPAIRHADRLSLIPNNICNLNCSYCYSARGRNNSRISIEKLDTTLNWFIDPKRLKTNFLSIFITGGGEPLATWDITSYAILKARELSRLNNVKAHISLITNGTLIEEKHIEFFKEMECSVCVSFDVVKDIQNSSRGKFDLIKNNIKALLSNGIRAMINSTIIPFSVLRMKEMTEEVIREYPDVSQFTMEPVTGVDLFGSAEEMRSFYDSFFKGYFEAKKIAQKEGLNLRFTFDDSLRGITPRHCPGKFVLTPSGKISICHLVSSPQEPRFSECTYGEIIDGEMVINEDKFNRLYSNNLFKFSECEDCVAKWSCGGECFTRRSTYPREYLAEVCRFNRKVVEHLLREEVKDVEFS